MALYKYAYYYYYYYYHSVNSSSHSVNGDIAIQWEWSNFDPSHNPNPLNNYDKTLHNWLRPRDEHVTQNLCQSAVRERLRNTWNIRPLFFIFIFFPDSPTEVTRAWNFTRDGSKHALWRKEVPFGGPHDGRHFEVKIPKKPSKMAFYKHVRASSNGLKTNDAIEDWCHWLAVARGGRAAYTIYSILEIIAAVFTTQRYCQLVHYIRYGNSVFAKCIQYL